MLVNTIQMLKEADKGKYAVGGFNVTSLETALAIAEAAQEEKSPVIIQISEKTIDYMGLDVAYAISKALSDRIAVPAAIHLDHGKNIELAKEAIQIGFSSVMLDVSKIEKDKRIPLVKEFVQQAHRAGVSVEVEEDVIGGREDYVQGHDGHFTDPARAALFVKETRCDSFAVSIGSAHGKPLPSEKLDLDLLHEIDKKVEVPLVLHGASSTPEQDIRVAIERGVCKINIDTDLRISFTRALRRTLDQRDIYDPRDELGPTVAEVKEVVKEKMQLFGSSGKVGGG